MSQTDQHDNAEAKPTTAEIRWRDSFEEFSLMAIGDFDINKARRMLEAEPKDILEMDNASVLEWWDSLGRFIRLGPLKDSEVDMDIPVFIAMVHFRGEDTPVLIDGWHRVRLAKESGDPIKFVVFSTDEIKDFHTPWN